MHAGRRDGAAARLRDPGRRAPRRSWSGRSDIVGKPVALLLLHQSATVTIAHSRTRDLAEVTRRADILVAAVGRPEMITGDMIKPGAAVIDVGINRTDAGLVGDVDYALGRRRWPARSPRCRAASGR